MLNKGLNNGYFIIMMKKSAIFQAKGELCTFLAPMVLKH